MTRAEVKFRLSEIAVRHWGAMRRLRMDRGEPGEYERLQPTVNLPLVA